jgi:intracellular multiplication protein IcmD
MRVNLSDLKKPLLFLAVMLGIFCIEAAFGDTGGKKNLGHIAEGITESFGKMGRLLIAVAYIAGLGFVIAAIFKFKQHKDNPTQIPLGTPVALLVIGVVLIFLPMIIEPAGQTIFQGAGKEITAGGEKGTGWEKIPGASSTGGQ